MALQTYAVAFQPQPGRVWLVAIAAGDADRKHLALLERSVVVDFVEHLPIGVIETACDRRNNVGVRQGQSR